MLHPALTNIDKWCAIEGRQLSRNINKVVSMSALLCRRPKVKVGKDVDVDANGDVF